VQKPIPSKSEAEASERELIARCIAGDRSAQRRLFERELPRAHATLYRILGTNHQIEDILQEVFLAVFRTLHTFRGDAKVATWIDRFTVNAAYAHLRSGRHRRHHLELLPDVMSSGAPGADRLALAREATRRLYATLDRLEAKQRMAFVLHAIEGRPLDEVAKLMDATVVATKARAWRARRFVEKRASVDPLLAEYVVAGAEGAAEGEEGSP
jgi:RNA polymerase sigma-70 factor (ECF subfamily)